MTLHVLFEISIHDAVEKVVKVTGGALDVLVDNSGGDMITPGLDIPMDDDRKLFDLNFGAPFAWVQAFAPLLIEAKVA